MDLSLYITKYEFFDDFIGAFHRNTKIFLVSPEKLRELNPRGRDNLLKVGSFNSGCKIPSTYFDSTILLSEANQELVDKIDSNIKNREQPQKFKLFDDLLHVKSRIYPYTDVLYIGERGYLPRDYDIILKIGKFEKLPANLFCQHTYSLREWEQRQYLIRKEARLARFTKKGSIILEDEIRNRC